MTSDQPKTRIYLFGQFCMQQSETIYQHFESSKVLELLCYLLVNRSRPQSREVLSVLLWGDASAARSKKYLRQAIWQLQAVLRVPADLDSAAAHLLQVDAAWVGLNRRADFWLDVDQFEHAYDLTHPLNGSNLSSEDVQHLKDAVALYKGDLLEGWYQDWCLFERERLQNMFFEMLEKLMVYSEAHQQFEEGIAYGTRILRCDRARERTYRSLMRLNFLSGDRTEALRQYERCEAALREELDVEPSQSTKELRHLILHEEPGLLSSLPIIPVTTAAPGSQSVQGDLLDQLHQFLAILVELQTRLEGKVHQIEKMIDSLK